MSTSRQRIFAACAPGLERVLARELEVLGLEARPVAGGAEAAGEDAVALACIGSRVAEAVRLRLYDGPDAGVADALAAARRQFDGTAEIRVRRRGGTATVSVDAGGALHRRGYRQRIGAAPLRETLAAGLLLACEYDGSRPFLDPMCGSGTIAIEAALLAARRAPGVVRRFPFEGWPGHDASRTAAVRSRLAGAARPAPAPIHASDRNGGAVRLARKNAGAAGVEADLRIERVSAERVVPPGVPGLCLTNPPYGRRLSEGAGDAWRALAALVPALAGWELAVVAPDRGLERLLPRVPVIALPFRNGGLACTLLRYRL